MGFIVILIGIIFWVYFYNRKKYHNLKHQIPASVVKNYLDSIIQNSTALKSSLFRGGGLDVDPSNIPSVFPTEQILTGNNQTGVSLDRTEVDAGLQAELTRLRSQIADKENIIKNLESETLKLTGVTEQKQTRIEELESLLAQDSSSSASVEELDSLKSERDELKEELEQYAVISDDLADLKSLKQENAQLKSALGANEELAANDEDAVEGVDTADEVAKEEEIKDESEEVAQSLDEAEVESKPSEEAEVESEEVVAASSESDTPTEETDQGAGYEKSSEDLLSEFEKMLG